MNIIIDNNFTHIEYENNSEYICAVKKTTKYFYEWRRYKGCKKAQRIKKEYQFIENNKILTGLLYLFSDMNLTITDNRIEPKPKNNFKSTFNLYPHQEKLLNDLSNRSIIHCATGSGKTVMAVAHTANLQLPALFLTHRIELLQQTIQHFLKIQNANIIPIAAGFDFDTLANHKDNNIYIGSVPSIYRHLNETVVKKWLKNNIHVLWMDETHHSSAMTWLEIANKCNAYYRYGLSGTPLNNTEIRNMLLTGVISNHIVTLSESELIDNGYLAEPIINVVPVTNKLVIKGDHTEAYKYGIVHNQKRNLLIKDIAKKMVLEHHKVLILINLIEHGKLLLELLKPELLQTEFVYGNVSKEKRSEIKHCFILDKINPLIASTIYDEGIDIPEIDCLILAGGGKSDIKTIQRIGRGMRQKKINNNLLYVFDFDDQHESKYLRKHFLSRLAQYKKKNYLIIKY